MSSTLSAPQIAPAKSTSSPMRFGFVLFDDDSNPREGWASVNGEDARRIDNISELSSDTYWWTNMSYESFFKKTETWRSPLFRHDAYLVTKPRDLLIEWGLDPAQTTPDFITSFCSKMFGRIMAMAYKLARECDPKLRMTHFFKGTTLREDLRFMLPKAEYPIGEAAAVMQAGQGFQEFTRTSVRGPKGAKQFMLRRPRMPYAMEMLTTPVPKGPFEFMPRSQLRSLSTDRVGWIRDSARPCMIEISVDSMQSEVAPVYAFGNATDKDRRIPRSWVAHPEFLVMSSFADIDVRNTWIGKEYMQMNLSLPEPVRQFLSDQYTEVSWTAGVIAETLWRSATLAEEKGKGPKGEPEERPATSWRGAWIRASDKASCFLSAMKLNDMGYATVSYGYGWVYCQVVEEQIPDLIKDGLTIGMMPRLSDVPEGLFDLRRAVPWGGDNKSKTLAHLTLTKRKQVLFNLDPIPLLDKSKQAEKLKSVLDAYKKGL